MGYNIHYDIAAIRFHGIEVSIGIYLYEIDCPEDAEGLETKKHAASTRLLTACFYIISILSTYTGDFPIFCQLLPDTEQVTVHFPV